MFKLEGTPVIGRGPGQFPGGGTRGKAYGIFWILKIL